MSIEERALAFEETETEPGELILDELRTFLSRFCVFPSPAALDAVTLWAAHTHFIEHLYTTGRLALLSPEPGSGKTRVLEMLSLLVPRPMFSASPSVAATFCKITKDGAVLLIDECDTIFSKRGNDDRNEDLRALINCGYKRGATIPRCVGSNHDVEDFVCYSAVALAGLGNLPQTILDRSVVIHMKRRRSQEKVQQYRSRMHDELGFTLRDRISDWATVVGQRVGDSLPELPPGIEDRKAEIWEPLIAVAVEAGGHWPMTAHRACTELANANTTHEVSLGIRLLQDCRQVFANYTVLPTTTLLGGLNGERSIGVDIDEEPRFIGEEAPWNDLYGESLSPRKLAQLLKQYDVSPKKVKSEGKALQGYRREDFWDAWERYLPPIAEEAEPTELQEPDTPDSNAPRAEGSASSGRSAPEGREKHSVAANTR